MLEYGIKSNSNVSTTVFIGYYQIEDKDLMIQYWLRCSLLVSSQGR